MRRWLVVVALVLAGCSGGARVGDDPAKGHAIRSNTPHVTVDEGASGEELLLTTQDLRAIDGLPKLTVTSVDETELYENPDPRGACGGKTDAMPLGGAALGITGSEAFGFQNVQELGDQASAILASERADARPDCPRWTSKTNTGSTQTGTFVGEVALPAIGDERLALQVSIENEGQTLEATTIVIRRGGTMVNFLLAMTSRLDDEVVVAIAERLSTKLDTA